MKKLLLFGLIALFTLPLWAQIQNAAYLRYINEWKEVAIQNQKDYNMARVSVIVPVFNAERYIEKCISSIARQTLEDIEIIAINDGTYIVIKDGKEEIFGEYHIIENGNIK